ncbi:MAG: cytidylate kinase-like family protein [Terriglobales bacterium]|jgi:cytidylate kinase
MYSVITVEREFGCGGGEIAEELSNRLGWKLWDQALTEEIAKLANVDCASVERRQEKVDGTFHRLAKIFWRGSYERSMSHTGEEFFDADCMVEMGCRVMDRAAREGRCVIVGRGAPYFLREHPEAFHVFLYAPYAEKLRRLQATGSHISGDPEELLNTVDRDRIAFVKRYFHADWPTRSLYHVMINTAIGDELVIATILQTMRSLEKNPVTTLTSFKAEEERAAQ